MEIFFNRKKWGKDEMKSNYENQSTQAHSLQTVKNRKSEDSWKGNLLPKPAADIRR